MSDQEPAEDIDHPATTPTARGGDFDGNGTARQLVDEEFSAFYRNVVPRLVGFLANQGATVAVATEIAQDTMVKAYQRWAEIDRPQAWVHTVASRALVRRIADIREDPVEQVPESTSLLPHPDAVAEWEVKHDMLRILRNLPPRQRQVLAWTLNGYTPSEIAKELRMTPNAVSASLRKARRAVTRHIEK